jgi:hypothetical protein
MTAEARSGSYSFTVTIPSLAYKPIIVKDVTIDTTIGEYDASGSGAITFTASLDSLHTFNIIENPSTMVNFADFAFFANHWMDTCVAPDWCDGCDFNKSGQVDLVDFATFVNHWMDTCVAPDWCDGCDLIR